MKLLDNILTARSAQSRRMQHNDEVDWDESGGFQVTPKSTGKGWILSSHLSTRSAKSAPIVLKDAKITGLRLFKRNLPLEQYQLHHPKTKTSTAQNLPTNQNVRRNIRRKRIEQIPDETRVMVVYGGGARDTSSTVNDAATVTTCTTGRSTVRTEPDEYTKRAMANLILRQLLNEDDKANMKNIVANIIDMPDPEEQRIDAMESSLEDPPQNGLEFLLFSCCGKCSTFPSPSLTPMTTVTANRTVFTGSTGSSFYSNDGSGSGSWFTNSFQSSLSWW